ncbi:MAG: UDP-N-acetylmuramoyl-L-alanyl-D-glutamate--2,6-diaminopimelate ligase [Planctomycetes bacterium]|nr:UDP-N-acetylmuramoyl-L-alanyl-D-glutamate--2,6-diaminopimelate ligase [Planctomycetota bacterium]MCL4729818.1 UDP-N-acetylmuramoyl-L-alanyl-D-glutamate--2,6-diaminopimelate ligase [Planctomycetota bacterium]
MRFSSIAKRLKFADPGIWVLNLQHLRVTGLCDDSRQVMPGNLFAAVPGTRVDGARFVRDALNRGASALLVERPLPEFKLVPQIVSPDVRRTLGILASMLYGDPSRHMTVVGITGTNGKTTSAFLMREVFEACGIGCGLMGTVCNIVGAERRPADQTTPGPLQVQQMLAEMRARGQQACVMEVSSHALDQQRVAGVRFAGAIFTNLTRDHLDYHKDFEHYFAAKAKLFEQLPPDGIGVFNLDDAWGERMRAACRGRALGFRFDAEADFRIEQGRMAVEGMTFGLRWRDRGALFLSPLTGRYNVQNIAGVTALALALGLPLQPVRAAVRSFRGAPGRLERVPHGSGPAVFVDYAHTPDAMQNVLETLRRVCAGRRLTVVFGCGGDRDRTKRPKMGAIAAALADRPIITSDNPRSERPEAIIQEILDGVPPQQRPVETFVDRREAITRAIAEAAPDDVIAILGKGHEHYQIFSDRTVHFDDTEEARNALHRHWGAQGSGRRQHALV